MSNVLSEIIEKINTKKNNPNNILNRFFIKNDITANDIFPTILYSNNIEDNFNKEINLPITLFNKSLLNKEENNVNIGDNYILYNNLDNNYLLSEQNIIGQNINKNIDIAKSNNKKDIKDFQKIASDIIENTNNYNDVLKIKGKDFEYLIDFNSQGQNITNLLNMKYIPFDQIKKDIDHEIDYKELSRYLNRCKVNKNKYNILKKYFYKNETLYNIYNLKNKNINLYFEKITVLNSSALTQNNIITSPKTDIVISFFTMDNKLKLEESYKKRKIYTETLNISLKQDTFVSYQNIKLNYSNYKNKDFNLIFNKMYDKIHSMTNDLQLSKNISQNCLNLFLNKYKDLNNIQTIYCYITPHNLSNFKYKLQNNKTFTYSVQSEYTLGDIDKTPNKLGSIKFFRGNFKNELHNSNALLHVKNKSSLRNINDLLSNIQPISEFNNDLYEIIDKTHILYTFILKKNMFLNFEKVSLFLSEEEVEKYKYYIYNPNNTINTLISFDKYLFKNLNDLQKFSQNILNMCNIKITNNPYKQLILMINNKHVSNIKSFIYNIKNKNMKNKINKKENKKNNFKK